MSTEQITQALSEMRADSEFTIGWYSSYDPEPKGLHKAKALTSAKERLTLITALEKACATLKKECCCPGEVSWTTGKDILCEPCETLTEISEMLGQGIG